MNLLLDTHAFLWFSSDDESLSAIRLEGPGRRHEDRGWWKAEQPGRAVAVYDDFSWQEIDEPANTPAP